MPEVGARAQQAARQRDPVLTRDVDVDQRHLGAAALDHLVALARVAGAPDDRAALAAEQEAQSFAERLVILHQCQRDAVRPLHWCVKVPRKRYVAYTAAFRLQSASHRCELRKMRRGSRAGPRRPGSRFYRVASDGEGHREAHPAALADLLPDGRAPPGHGPGDPPRRRGLLRDERGRLRAALLRRPRGARVAGHPALGREARRRRSTSRRTTRCAPENFHLPADRVHRLRARRAAARRSRCSTASSPTPSRCGSRSSRSPGAGPTRSRRSASSRSRSASPRPPAGASSPSASSKIDTAIYRRKTIEFDYYTMERDADEHAQGRPLPACSSRAGSSTSSATRTSATRVRVFRLSRIRGKVAYATKAEHDFQRPADFDPREYANRGPMAARRHRSTPPRSGSPTASPGRSSATSASYGEMAEERDGGRVFRTEYGAPRQLISWVLGLGEHARVLGPASSSRTSRSVVELTDRAPHRRPRPGQSLARAPPSRPPRAVAVETNGRREAAIRPERFARLVTLASVLIAAGPRGPAPAGRRRAASACRSPSRSCARTSTSSTSSTSAAAPTCSTPRCSTPARSRSTPSPTPTTSRAPRGCCPSRPRRWWRRST